MSAAGREVLARALGFAWSLLGAGQGVTLVMDGETATAWVSRAGRVHRLRGGCPDARRQLAALARGPVFFLLGPRSGSAPGVADDTTGLLVEADLEVEIGPEGRCACTGRDPAEAGPEPAPFPAVEVERGLGPGSRGWQGEPDQAFRERVAEALVRLDGQDGKVIVTRGFQRACPPGRSLFELAARLLLAEPEAAAAHLCFLADGTASFGTSPELVFRTGDRRLTVDAVAGSRPRLTDPPRSSGLLDSEKEGREHGMALARAEAFVARHCEPGSASRSFTRRVRCLRAIEHLQSRVEGILRHDVSPFDVLEACHPPLVSYPETYRAPGEPAWSTPKFYGGQVGRATPDSLQSYLNLRCIEGEAGWLRTRSGVGVVAGADPDREVEESLLKLSTVFSVTEAWCLDPTAR